MKFFVTLTLFSFVLTGCAGMFTPAVPLSQAEVKRLTTCDNADLKTIRKNLLLAGYVVTKTTDDDLVTDFKQVGAGSYNKKWVRVTAVKVDDKTIRFKTREKLVSTERVADETEESSYTGSRYASKGRHKGPTKQTTTYRNQTVQNETDSLYTDRTRQMHETLHAEICNQ